MPTFGQGVASPLQRRCTWAYEQLTTVQQDNLLKCQSGTVDTYTAYKAFEDNLFNEVYPLLVRFRPCVKCVRRAARARPPAVVSAPYSSGIPHEQACPTSA